MWIRKTVDIYSHFIKAICGQLCVVSNMLSEPQSIFSSYMHTLSVLLVIGGRFCNLKEIANLKMHCIQCVTSWHEKTIVLKSYVTNEIWVDNYFGLISLNMFILICSWYYWYIIETRYIIRIFSLTYSSTFSRGFVLI